MTGVPAPRLPTDEQTDGHLDQKNKMIFPVSSRFAYPKQLRRRHEPTIVFSACLPLSFRPFASPNCTSDDCLIAPIPRADADRSGRD
jgi:hypothetical protein